MDRVYIETTIPSAYSDKRTEPEMVARRIWTREWWDKHRHAYELVTSAAVLQELARGAPERIQERLALLADVEVLAAEPAALDIAEVYVDRHVMPRGVGGDALHLALASFHKCDILLTWNCQHLANYRKFDHIRRVNTLLGLHVPLLLTPLELLGGGAANET
jgi:predicted nucleic acid-binding protein